MRFKLNNKWSIDTEINQVVLIQTTIGQEGKCKGKLIDGRRWYWNNFEDTLNGMIDRDIQCLEKVEEIEERIKTLKSDIELMLKSMNENPSLPRFTTYRKKKVLGHGSEKLIASNSPKTKPKAKRRGK